MAASIKATDLVIEFPLYNSPNRSLKNSILGAATGGRLTIGNGGPAVVRALDRVNFEIKEGDRVALTGHNGSGKSTLLRALSGVYEPISGTLDISGRVASLIDLQLGMDGDATGIENIYLRGILMGRQTKEIKNVIDDVIAFAELGEFINLPMRTYSSGMILRLAFAVSTAFKVDILLMDEWLSVGDSNFNEKASDRLRSLIKNTGILVFATHSEEMKKSLCNLNFEIKSGLLTKTQL